MRTPTIPHADAVARVVRASCGLALADARDEALELRLGPRLRELGADLGAYARAIAADPQERARAIELLVAGHTAWWREPEHFADLRERVLPRLRERAGQARIWCAGCSTGEEAYGIALCARQVLGDEADVAILATDISMRALAVARAARYAAPLLAALPPAERELATMAAPGTAGEREVRPELRRLVHFARHNLVGEWPMSGGFDAIFCRNVLIHLTTEARARIARRLCGLLRPSGTLYLGQAELLEPGIVPARALRPSIHVA